MQHISTVYFYERIALESYPRQNTPVPMTRLNVSRKIVFVGESSKSSQKILQKRNRRLSASYHGGKIKGPSTPSNIKRHNDTKGLGGYKWGSLPPKTSQKADVTCSQFACQPISAGLINFRRYYGCNFFSGSIFFLLSNWNMFICIYIYIYLSYSITRDIFIYIYIHV